MRHFNIRELRVSPAHTGDGYWLWAVTAGCTLVQIGRKAMSLHAANLKLQMEADRRGMLVLHNPACIMGVAIRSTRLERQRAEDASYEGRA